MTEQYWRWPESAGRLADIDWKKAKAITAGVDVGIASTQAAIICDDTLFSYANLHTGADPSSTAAKAMERALENTGMKADDIRYTVATGYFRQNVPSAHKAINEITCHAKGARFMFGPTVRTILDMGAETSKAIKVNESGGVTDIAVNDKCATGFGESIEMLADLTHVPIEDIGARSLSVAEEPGLPVSTTCRIFATTEAIGLLRGGAKENDMLAAYLYTVAYRLYPLVGRLDPEKDLALTGGVAKNPGVVKRLEKVLGLTALTSKYDPQLAGAIGAALYARTLTEKVGRAPGGV